MEVPWSSLELAETHFSNHVDKSKSDLLVPSKLLRKLLKPYLLQAFLIGSIAGGTTESSCQEEGVLHSQPATVSLI